MTAAAGIVALGLVCAGAARAADPPSAVPEGRGPGAITFAGIPWGLPMDSVAARLTARGYEVLARDRGVLRAQGRVFDRWATIAAGFDDGGVLARWILTLPVPEEAERDRYAIQRGIYDGIVLELEARHGRRRMRLDRFQFPYKRGDGREANALRDGMADIRSAWGHRGDRLEFAIGADLTLTLTYTSPRWDAAERARRRRKAADL